MKFQEISLMNFPAEDCTIKLRVNGNFFRSEKKYLVSVLNKDNDQIIILDAYACLGNNNGFDSFGFISTKSELEYYSLDNPQYELIGMMDYLSVGQIIGELLDGGNTTNDTEECEGK